MYLGDEDSGDGNIIYRSSKLLVYCTVLFMYLGDEDSGDEMAILYTDLTSY